MSVRSNDYWADDSFGDQKQRTITICKSQQVVVLLLFRKMDRHKASVCSCFYEPRPLLIQEIIRK